MNEDEIVSQVKDIMTAYENRVLREIEELHKTKIEPMEQVVSGLMLTISDLTMKLSAFLEVYAEQADPVFVEKVNERAKEWQRESLRILRNEEDQSKADGESSS